MRSAPFQARNRRGVSHAARRLALGGLILEGQCQLPKFLLGARAGTGSY